MLLSKIPALDKGYVALIASSGTSERLNEVSMEFFKRSDSHFLRELATMTLVIKCPLFVQLNLSKYGFKIISAPVTEGETYNPHVGEIGCQDLETNRNISANIKMTADALLINPQAYQEDGCDRFVSQVLTPISMYTTLLVHGPYSEWKKFCNQPKVPLPMKAYTMAVNQIMDAEWK